MKHLFSNREHIYFRELAPPFWGESIFLYYMNNWWCTSFDNCLHCPQCMITRHTACTPVHNACMPVHNACVPAHNANDCRWQVNGTTMPSQMFATSATCLIVFLQTCPSLTKTSIPSKDRGLLQRSRIMTILTSLLRNNPHNRNRNKVPLCHC